MASPDRVRMVRRFTWLFIVILLFTVAWVLWNTYATERQETGKDDRARVVSDPVIDVHMGTGIGPNGMVPETVRGDDFRPGETIIIAAKLRDMEGQPITVRWFAFGDVSAGTETAAVKNDGTVQFSKTDTKSWVPGDYRVTLSAGERTLISEQFHILGSEAAANPNK